MIVFRALFGVFIVAATIGLALAPGGPPLLGAIVVVTATVLLANISKVR